MFFNKPNYATQDSFYKGLNAQSESNVRTNKLSNKDLKFLRDTIDSEVKGDLYGK